MTNQNKKIDFSKRVNGIPPMTHSLSFYWEQPSRENILTDTTHAYVSDFDFKRLKSYNTSNPSGVYLGKMWKSKSGDHWLLCWYDETNDPYFCKVVCRVILRDDQ